MQQTPFLSNAQVIGYALAIVSLLGGIISLLFWRYIASLEQRLKDAEEGRRREVEAERKEKERAWQQYAELQRTMGVEAEKDRVTLREINASWQATLDPPRRGR